MKMGSSETCLASVAHNVDKNIPDDTPTCREHQGKFWSEPLLPGADGLWRRLVEYQWLTEGPESVLKSGKLVLCNMNEEVHRFNSLLDGGE